MDRKLIKIKGEYYVYERGSCMSCSFRQPPEPPNQFGAKCLLKALDRDMAVWETFCKYKEAKYLVKQDGLYYDLLAAKETDDE